MSRVAFDEVSSDLLKKISSHKNRKHFSPLGKICNGDILFHECKIYIIVRNQETLKRNYRIAMMQLNVKFSQTEKNARRFQSFRCISYEKVFVL